jgi:peptidoglycan hydrolase-like protein with peptidoglycan-binding domain
MTTERTLQVFAARSRAATASHQAQPARPFRRTPDVRHILRAPQVQTKLKIGAVDDPAEREADRVADQVMRMPARTIAADGDAGSRPIAPTGMAVVFPSAPARIQRVCGECEHEMQRQSMKEDEDKLLQKKESAASGTPAVTPEVQAGVDALRGGGEPLAAPARAFFGPRFGRDFGHVRVHTGAQAARSARAVNAQAYTIGHDIVFGEGRYAPGTESGRRLLAHELTHTVQQGGPASPAKLQRTIGDGHDLTPTTRFSGVVELEAAFDDERTIQVGHHGNFVTLIQQSLLDMGYTLPQFGADGTFGAETKAAIERFQTDAGAALIDGIVGPETMGLLDQHDVTNQAGQGPPRLIGPVAPPRPGVAAGCDQNFAGVAFTLANQVATGVAASANINIAVDRRGRFGLSMAGIAPANYQPQITINAPSNAIAGQFEVGLIQNLLTDRLEYTFSTGAVLRSTLPTPIKDGAPLVSGVYHPIFAENGGGHANILLPFATVGDTVQLNLPDTPSDFAMINLNDNPECVGLPAAATLTNALLIDEFRTWIGVRHRPSGCIRTIHHIDWTINWSATVNGNVNPPTRVVTSRALTVPVGNGNGTPTFVQGGRVPADLIAANRVCN